ncbi:MAG: type II toxin-antitoxin system RnlA family toxin [Clostridiales bacterium]|nr:type II toxin-antitoxin system RnlA family toxin [Clostridiales bacterium]
MENVRYNISPCSAAEVTEFIRKIDHKTFTPNGVVNATERSHYDRYSYLAGENRIAVVYDTTACILSITGRSDFAQTLLDLYAPNGKTIKRSTVPSQGTPAQKPVVKQVNDTSMRAKIFVTPDSIQRRREFVPVPTLFVTSKGAEISTDEIYPPQIMRKKDTAGGDSVHTPHVIQKRPLPSYGESQFIPRERVNAQPAFGSSQEPARREIGDEADKQVGLSISVARRNRTDSPRISFGSNDTVADDDNASLKINTRFQPAPAADEQVPQKRKRGRPPKNAPPVQAQAQEVPTEKRKRGRPPKNKNEQYATADIVPTPEYKNGYSVKNFPFEALTGALKRLKSYGKTVNACETEFSGTIQEIKNYTVSDAEGQKVLLRYATKRMTLQLQGKRSNLFGEVMSLVGGYSDYSSALENYVEESGGSNKVSAVQNKLKKRLPTAFEYLSEQSRIDFSYGIHDFSQSSLHLSDYSVLLVPAFRGLERFVFDLQSAEGIKVKMIGQAFDKDDSGKYILKSGYTQRIGSVIYAEVLVALYSEYFAQRNFFAHSDNTESNMSRAIPERAAAQKIFEHLLDVVEYNAKKLKEIGFSIK